MSILLVFSSSELGGAERSLTRMAMEAGSAEYQVATLDGPGPWVDWVYACGADPVVFGNRSNRRHGRFGWSAISSLMRFARQERIRAIYVCGLRAALVLRLLKPLMPKIRIVQGVRWNPNSQSRIDRVFRLVERLLHRHIDLYIANSKAAAATLVRCCAIPSDRVRVIYNGVPSLPKDPIPLTSRDPIVLTVANLSPRKGYIEYLPVVQNVLKHVPHSRFVFVGRDEMAGAVQSEIQRLALTGSVEYVGFREDVELYFREASVFVLPSLRNEGCPTAILEAMAHEIPVVAYSIDGIPELVSSGVDGVLVPVNDTSALASSIVDLLVKREMAEHMGRSGRAKVKAEFSMEACVSRHRDALSPLPELG